MKLAAAAVAVWLGAWGQAQGIDYAKIEILTEKVAPNLYMLSGSGGADPGHQDAAGGRIGVLAGPDGIFMVDAQYSQITDKVVAAIRKISAEPIRFLVNTHVHGDHTAGDANFVKMGALLFAREELREEMLRSPGGDPGGDTMVRFENADVIMIGDFYRNYGYPFIDTNNGGTLKGALDALELTMKVAGPNTRLVPGHGTVINRTDIVPYRDMILGVEAKVRQMIGEGKSVQEVLAAKVTAPYDAKVPGGLLPAGAGTSADRFVSMVYSQLKGGK
jgi:cyclase